MPAAPPQSASGSIFDFMARLMPQSSGVMKASDALGMAASRNDLAAQLAKLKAAGPTDGMHTKAWQDQVDALTKQLGTTK
jgi:hypothetical protein